jgi:hypothetical protein
MVIHLVINARMLSYLPSVSDDYWPQNSLLPWKHMSTIRPQSTVFCKWNILSQIPFFWKKKCWPKCEHDYETTSIVNRTLMIRVQLWKLILQFLLISRVENYSKFNIYLTLGLRIRKPPPWNPTNHELSNSTKSLPYFILFYFILLFGKFLGQNCSIFNNSCVVGLNTTKPPQCTHHTHWAFQQYQEHSGGNMIWRMLNVTKKTNKQPSLIDKCCHQFFSFAKFSQNEKSKKGIFFSQHSDFHFSLVSFS